MPDIVFDDDVAAQVETKADYVMTLPGPAPGAAPRGQPG